MPISEQSPAQDTATATGRHRRRRSATVAIVAAIVVAGGVGTAFVRRTDAGADPEALRTATATRASFAQTWDGVGTIEPVRQATVAFPNDGVVTSVEVVAGDRVEAGEVIATQDSTDLERAVHESQATLDQRRLAYTRLASGSSSNGATADSSISGGAASGTGSATGDAAAAPSSGAAGANASSGDATGAGSTSASASAEALYAAQLEISTAELALADAQAALAQTAMTSPIDGTVVAVGIEPGTASSAEDPVVIVGDGGFEVTVDVTVDDLRDIAVGQSAVVRADGGDREVAGEVSMIAVAPDTSSGTATYGVTVALTGDATGLRNGSLASVTITTAEAVDAVAVPTSAVTPEGDQHTVRVVGLEGTEVATVEVGAVGATWTEIVAGIDEGDQVVLAEIDDPLPSSATEASETTAGGAGGPGGVGGPGGPPTGAGGAFPQPPNAGGRPGG